MIRDRDRIYGSEVRLRITSLGIEEVLTAPRSPWQNPYVERLIGSIRRDCLHHFVILNTSRESWLGISLTTRRRGPIWASISNARSLARSSVSAGLSRSHNSRVCITVMNALLHSDMSADAFLAMDRL